MLFWIFLFIIWIFIKKKWFDDRGIVMFVLLVVMFVLLVEIVFGI
jgi:hypothetical protein